MSSDHRTLSLGFSPCPNDTFMFHELVHGGEISCHPTLLDIEALNQRALSTESRFDITKLSLPALARCIDDYSVLASGAALGHGCGPLVVRREQPLHRDSTEQNRSLADLAGRRVAVPGENTTAFLLLKIFAPGFTAVVMRFDEIMAAVAAERVSAGLIIHESRFTFRDHGLEKVADLGEIWESATDLPLPLGLIAARRDLPDELHLDVESALRRSIEIARADGARSRDYVRAHSQEMDAEVCRQHIELYVNDFSVDLGEKGRRAVEELLRRGRDAGHLPPGRSPWRGAD